MSNFSANFLGEKMRSLGPQFLNGAFSFRKIELFLMPTRQSLKK